MKFTPELVEAMLIDNKKYERAYNVLLWRLLIALSEHETDVPNGKVIAALRTGAGELT